MSKAPPPQTTDEWFEYGRECFHKPDGINAVKAFERVIADDPAYRSEGGDNPYFYLGKIHEVEGNLKAAILNYTRALAVDPYDEESYIGRGSCYTVTRQHQEAIADFTKVLQFTAAQRKAPRQHLLYAIGENYRLSRQWDQALLWGKKALAVDPLNFRIQELVKEANANLKG
ncbi:MAG: tetratricopeptide repeat protein [Desulfobacteraceae bacterium]|nr:tetratricopeptide repeat protein [Desulfobacteraceae bacterium]